MKFRRSLNTVGLFIVKEALSFCLDRWSDWQWRNEPSTRYTASSLLSLHQILLQIQTKKPCGSQLLYQTHPRRNTAAQPDPPTHEREHFNSCGSGWWTERFHRCRQVANMLYCALLVQRIDFAQLNTTPLYIIHSKTAPLYTGLQTCVQRTTHKRIKQ